MSGFHLPRIFVRRDTVDADLSALVRLLPDARPRFDPATFTGAVEFVLDHGEPRPEERALLVSLLTRVPL